MGTPWSIAILDDDDAVRVALTRLCTAHGHRARSFACAQQLFDSLDEGSQPDCIILDVQMPGLSGIEVQAWLRDREFDIPAVMITGREDRQMRERSLALGASAYLCKPMDAAVLLGAVEKAIARV